MPVHIYEKGITFYLTYKCVSECEVCYTGASPRRRGVMELKDAVSYLEEVRDTPYNNYVVIEGGEPMIYGDLTLEIVKAAKRILNADDIRIMTDGFFGKDPELARKKLLELKNAGLTFVLLSVDAFHQKRIPLDSVRNAIQAAREADIENVWVCSLTVGSIEMENEFNLTTKSLISQLGDLGDTRWEFISPIVTGRAAEFLPQYLPLKGIPKGECHPIFFFGENLKDPIMLNIDNFGWVWICPGLCIGNAKEKPLSKIIEDYDYASHPIIQKLVDEKPIGLMEMAKSKGYVPREGYIDECHLCYDVRKFLRPCYPQYLAPENMYAG